jgi:hypothetical protein
MFKKLSLVAMLVMCIVCSQNGVAAECVDSNGQDIFSQPEVFFGIIEKSESCYEAVEMAEACAYGSSLDVSTAGVAYDICEKELQVQKPTKELINLLKTMQTSCSDKYYKEEGTMYRSMNAFCQLSALEWVLNIATPN